MAQVFENTAGIGPSAGTCLDKATATKFMQDLAKDYRNAKSEFQSDKVAENQDKQDGKLAKALLSELSSGKLHVQNEAQFRQTLHQTLHNAHRDLSLESQYERGTTKRANAELAVMQSLSQKFGIKLPDLKLTGSVQDNSLAPGRAIDADLANARAELTGDIQARTYDQQDIDAAKNLTSQGQQFLDIPGIQAMFSALQTECRNSRQDIHDEHLYQTDSQVRVNLDTLAGGKI